MSQHEFPFPFTSSGGFLGVMGGPADAPLAVVGLPWDGAVTNRPGARFGPDAIRRASRMLCDGIHPLFDVSPIGRLADFGDLALPNTSLAAMRTALEAAAPKLIAARQIAWLGGDHSLTLSLLRAYRADRDEALAVVHFDAHCDTWRDHFGEASGHGTWLFEAVEEGLADPAATVQIGLRSSGAREARDYIPERGGRVFSARELRGRDGEALAPVIAEVRRRVAGRPVYLSLDIDCLDPAFAPGTGTPEPGGLATSQVLTLLEELADLPWVGMDCVEVSPPYDHAEITANAAATFVWTWLCGVLARGA